MRVVLASIAAFGAALALPQQTRAVEGPARDARVEIPGGASLEQVLDAFKDATGLPCIAEAPTTERHAGQPFTGSLTGAARYVRETLDYHVQAQGRALLFYRQYSFPEDHPTLSVSELGGLAADLYRLVHPFLQPPVTGDMAGDQEALIASFTPEQLRLLGDPGLPVAALPPAQARLWSSINSNFVYANANQRLQELAEYFRHWKECEVYRYQGRAAGDQRLGVRFPQAGAPAGYARHLIPEWYSDRPMRVSHYRHDAAVLPERQNRLPARFDRKLDLSAGSAPLESLVGAVHAATGVDIRLPDSASRYRFVTTRGSVEARDLVDALTQMHGWHCDPDTRGRYTLARPRYGAARTPLQLHQAVVDLVPPSLVLLATQPASNAWAWERAQLDRVKALQNPTALAAGVKVTELPADVQEGVAQALTLNIMAPLFMGTGVLDPDYPRGFMLTPEQSTLHMGSGAQPGAKIPSGFVPAAGVFRVTVPRPTGGTDEWGWAVGSASVKR